MPIFFGIPFEKNISKMQKLKMDYIRKTKRIAEIEYLTFDAIRIIMHIIGKVLNSQSDYTTVIFADKKYTAKEKIELFPDWFQKSLPKKNNGLSTDFALPIIKEFLKQERDIQKVMKQLKQIKLNCMKP